MACSEPPAERARWTVRLVAEEAVKRKLVPRVGREAVRILLLHHDLKPWGNSRRASCGSIRRLESRKRSFASRLGKVDSVSLIPCAFRGMSAPSIIPGWCDRGRTSCWWITSGRSASGSSTEEPPKGGSGQKNDRPTKAFVSKRMRGYGVFIKRRHAPVRGRNYAVRCASDLSPEMAAWAAARRAIGTR